jgi:hypothetical protein
MMICLFQLIFYCFFNWILQNGDEWWNDSDKSNWEMCEIREPCLEDKIWTRDICSSKQSLLLFDVLWGNCGIFYKDMLKFASRHWEKSRNSWPLSIIDILSGIWNILKKYTINWMFCWPRIIVYQCNESNVMYFSFNWLRIKGPYIYRALLAHPQ